MSIRTWLSLSIALGLVGCGKDKEPQEPPPALVDVITVQSGEIPNVVELPGRIEAVRSAEVRARTTGIVLRRLYEEGERVEEGDVLFELDPRDYRAQVEQAKATLARYEATRNNAAALVRRYEPLAERRAVSSQEFDTAKADLAQAEAQMAEGRASIARAQLQLDFATIRAPIAGIAGRAEVTEGALVSSGEATLMTRIDQTTPIFATFTASSTSILDATLNAQSGALKLPPQSTAEVRLILENGTEYGPRGRLDFTSPVVDPSTGSQIVRAKLPNDATLLKPGQLVTGRINSGTIQGGITIPTRSVQMKGEQASVYLLGSDGTVVSRPLTLGPMLTEGWVVKEGLKPGERVIVEGWQKVRPGQKATTQARVIRTEQEKPSSDSTTEAS